MIPMADSAEAAAGRARPPRRRVPPPVSWTVDRVRVEPVIPGGSISLEGLGEFRGAVDLLRSPAGVAVINDVDVEDYVKGIAEVPPSWPAEALRAQAIAARTYALSEVVSDAPTLARSLGADICATESCQVYAGLAKERQAGASSWISAVDSTRGQVLLFAGLPIVAKYSSSNGGKTVAGGRPYLKPVDDPDDAKSPHHRWRVSLTYAQLASAFGLGATPVSVRREGDTIVLRGARGEATGGSSASKAGQGEPTSPPASPAPVSPGGSPEGGSSGAPPSPPADKDPPESDEPGAESPEPPGPKPPTPPPPPDAPLAAPANQPGIAGSARPQSSTRPAEARGESARGAAEPAAAGSPSELRVSVGEFRTRLNATIPAPAGVSRPVPSVIFTLRPDDAGGVLVLEGRAFGHGIGMSQFGALGKALRGLKAAAILAAYYGGIRPAVPPAGKIATRLRVLLDGGRPSLSVSSPGMFRVLDGASNPVVAVGAGTWQVTPGARKGIRVVAPHGQGGAPTGQVLGIDQGDPVSGSALSVRFRLDTPALVSILFRALPGEEPVAAQVLAPPTPAGAGEGSLAMVSAPPPGSPVPVLLLDAGGGRRAELLLPFGDAFAPASPLPETLPAESSPTPAPEPRLQASPARAIRDVEKSASGGNGWPPATAMAAFSAVALLAWQSRRRRSDRTS
ncbi:MAG: SpoIID/LytB domain-containing protein [Acidimicrobiia bacterium]